MHIQKICRCHLSFDENVNEMQYAMHENLTIISIDYLTLLSIKEKNRYVDFEMEFFHNDIANIITVILILTPFLLDEF